MLRVNEQTRGVAGVGTLAIKRVYLCFDGAHDQTLAEQLEAEAKQADSPFAIVDQSRQEPLTDQDRDKLRARLEHLDVMIVLCGEHTNKSRDMGVELMIAQQAKLSYFLLRGYERRPCRSPLSAKNTDKLYPWTWDNLKNLVKRYG